MQRCAAFLVAATGTTFYALGQKASYFYMPADLQAATLEPGQRIRLGGLVEKGSIVRGQGTQVSFGVTDHEKSVNGDRSGICRTFSGRTGRHHRRHLRVRTARFVADSVLAKHDETYMPKEVADGLKAKGVWQEN